jgi:hypothetical protein
MKLKNIDFIFENCDVISIDGKYIGDFLVDDVSTSIQRIACNSIEEMTTAHTIAIEIHKNANRERYQFDQSQIEHYKQMTFDRFASYNDITAIEFTLEGKDEDVGKCHKYHYYVDWVGDSDYTNEAQVNYRSNLGHLYICIKKDGSLSDYFDTELINDSEYMEFAFSMMDVGDDEK